MKSNQDPLKELTRKHRFRLLGIDTRTTFLMVRPLIESTSKTLLTVCTFIFAGSLTFIGLRDNPSETLYLKLSWVMLGLSVFFHLMTHAAALDALMSHGRTETDGERAKEKLSEAKDVPAFFKEAFSSHYNQGVFHRSADLLILFLFLQSIAVIAGGTLMAIFIWRNI